MGFEEARTASLIIEALASNQVGDTPTNSLLRRNARERQYQYDLKLCNCPSVLCTCQLPTNGCDTSIYSSSHCPRQWDQHGKYRAFYCVGCKQFQCCACVWETYLENLKKSQPLQMNLMLLCYARGLTNRLIALAIPQLTCLFELRRVSQW